MREGVQAFVLPCGLPPGPLECVAHLRIHISCNDGEFRSVCDFIL